MHSNNSTHYILEMNNENTAFNMFNCYRHYQSNFPNYTVKEIMNDDK